MTVSLVEKARHNRLIALRSLHICKSGSERVSLFPSVDKEEEQMVFSSRRAQRSLHHIFMAA